MTKKDLAEITTNVCCKTAFLSSELMGVGGRGGRKGGQQFLQQQEHETCVLYIKESFYIEHSSHSWCM